MKLLLVMGFLYQTSIFKNILSDFYLLIDMVLFSTRFSQFYFLTVFIDFQPIFLLVETFFFPTFPQHQVPPIRKSSWSFTSQMVLLLITLSLQAQFCLASYILYQFSIFQEFIGIFCLLLLSSFQFSCHLYLFTIIWKDIWERMEKIWCSICHV